jgi:nitrate reductase NapAB chaperone NapD
MKCLKGVVVQEKEKDMVMMIDLVRDIMNVLKVDIVVHHHPEKEINQELEGM